MSRRRVVSDKRVPIYLDGKPESLDVLTERDDLTAGILQKQAQISPKYFYDSLGSRLFKVICELDEYYLTRTETWIMKMFQCEISIATVSDMLMIDLGAGNCAKVSALFGVLKPREYYKILCSDFDPRFWRHVARFNVDEARIEMHLAAKCDLAVVWPGGSRNFVRGETIHTESSYKYSIEKFLKLLATSGFGNPRCWSDEASSFLVCYAEAIYDNAIIKRIREKIELISGWRAIIIAKSKNLCRASALERCRKKRNRVDNALRLSIQCPNSIGPLR
jgi:uncharacterized SAM-dependent methyltransferase